MTGPIINIGELEFREFGKGERFRARRGAVSSRIGASKLAYSVVRVPAGKRAWPYHAHHVIEEMFYILEGAGTLRHAGEEYAVNAGDFICSPADPKQPHQLINTSEIDLVYIAVSTQEEADIVLYPDSGKYGGWSGKGGDPRSPDSFRVIAREETAVDYWDGESD